MTAIKKGFTLIELLIVIAILGVLAVVVLVAINPQEQLARTRDAGRTSSVTQIGHALQAYATVRGEYIIDDIANCGVADNEGWATCLVDAGEIATVPSPVDYSVSDATVNACVGNNTDATAPIGGFCYIDDGSATSPRNAIVFARLESNSNNDRCTTAALPEAYVVFDTVQGRGGIVCVAAGGEPAYIATGQVFIN